MRSTQWPRSLGDQEERKRGTLILGEARNLTRAHPTVETQLRIGRRPGVFRITGEVRNVAVGEAPEPRLTRFDRPDHWMTRRSEMGGRVAIWALVTAADVPADHALAEMQPPAADLEAVFAAVGRVDQGCLERFGEMLADLHASQCDTGRWRARRGRSRSLAKLILPGGIIGR